VLDVGCGSGLLAIAAAKLGHAPVVAVDVDPSAVDAASTNAARNGVTLDVRRLDARLGLLPAAVLALANVARDAVEAMAPRLQVERLITSGYLSSEQPALAGFRHLARRERDGWAADLHERR
jgi:ribosomal protein L11 methyltransferase